MKRLILTAMLALSLTFVTVPAASAAAKPCSISVRVVPFDDAGWKLSGRLVRGGKGYADRDMNLLVGNATDFGSIGPARTTNHRGRVAWLAASYDLPYPVRYMFRYKGDDRTATCVSDTVTLPVR